MFKESNINLGSGGSTESSEEMRKRAKDIPEAQEAREKASEFRGLSSQERAAQIRGAVEALNIKRALVLIDVAPESEQTVLHRSIYEELMRRGEFVRAARLAQMKISADPRSTGLHNFTSIDVRRAAVPAYWKALRHPEAPLEDEGPDARSDAELIARDFELTDKDIGPLPKAA